VREIEKEMLKNLLSLFGKLPRVHYLLKLGIGGVIKFTFTGKLDYVDVLLLLE